MITQVSLIDIHLFGTWHRELSHDTCSICKESINETAPITTSHMPKETEEINHFTEESSRYTLRVGACGHVFHTCCIQPWLQQRAVCPLCNLTWVTDKKCL